ncbi:uncharacterized protein LOC116585755 [Mustela erminea]|uniref:uncharacterized protein LOC116585755 n=1 Tax=Mustela erminea TaxID=36723 RepID=UPI001386AEB8|nr:uncharacterized protein LOC116585755 [Mustela erminea]
MRVPLLDIVGRLLASCDVDVSFPEGPRGSASFSDCPAADHPPPAQRVRVFLGLSRSRSPPPQRVRVFLGLSRIRSPSPAEGPRLSRTVPQQITLPPRGSASFSHCPSADHPPPPQKVRVFLGLSRSRSPSPPEGLRLSRTVPQQITLPPRGSASFSHCPAADHPPPLRVRVFLGLSRSSPPQITDEPVHGLGSNTVTAFPAASPESQPTWLANGRAGVLANKSHNDSGPVADFGIQNSKEFWVGRNDAWASRSPLHTGFLLEVPLGPTLGSIRSYKQVARSSGARRGTGPSKQSCSLSNCQQAGGEVWGPF